MSSGTDSGTSHAALMDRVYRRQRYVYDLTRKYYLFGRDRLIRELALRPGESVLEVGCGTARNLVRIAGLYPGSQLYGLDASAEMLRTARHRLAKAGLSDRIRLVHGYAESVSPRLLGRDRPFDRIIFPYSLSMIPDWRQALNSASNSLDESGSVHAVDFGDFAGLGWFGAKLLRQWLRLFHVEPRITILRALERAERRKKGERLVLLPGRYAFLWSGSRRAAHDLSSLDVAAWSQPGGNSGSGPP